MVKFGSARNGENGARGNQPGDQTGREVMIQEGYIHKNGWKIIRAKDPNIANALAFSMLCACCNDEVGYDQNDRYSIFFTGITNGIPTECDCSSLVAWCCVNCGITNFEVNGFYTGNEIERLLGTGAFNVFGFTSLNDLYTGDILVDGNGTAHTIIVTEGKPRTTSNQFDEPLPTLCWGSKGDEVRKLQRFFNDFCGCDIAVDGDFGPITYGKVRDFQAFFGLVVDGIYGPKTHDTLVAVLFFNGVEAV